jgi:hypothetical protein
MERMKRHEFFAKVGSLDADRLRHILWKLYYPGGSQIRQRIEDALEPGGSRRRKAAEGEPDAAFLLEEVKDFCRLARGGAYVAGSREVSPSERRKWRHGFRRLLDDAVRSLAHAGFDEGARALEQLLDLICEATDIAYFRSKDPVQAAKVVVSDTAGILWKASLEHEGFPGFARRAAPQLLRWERAYGWTRYGDGSVAQKETSLASLLVGHLTLPDMWVTMADSYLTALDAAAQASSARGEREDAHRHDTKRYVREQRARNLAEWHQALLEHLAGSDAEDRLERLVRHPALEGPEMTFLQARLAQKRGDLPRARSLATQCLESLPGHRGFLAFAEAIAAPIPARAAAHCKRSTSDRRQS